MKHNKFKVSDDDKGLTRVEKGEIVFLLFFTVLLGAAVLAFIIAAIQLIGGYLK